MVLALFEPVLALPDASRSFCMFFLVACFRSLLWLPDLLHNLRMARMKLLLSLSIIPLLPNETC